MGQESNNQPGVSQTVAEVVHDYSGDSYPLSRVLDAEGGDHQPAEPTPISHVAALREVDITGEAGRFLTSRLDDSWPLPPKPTNSVPSVQVELAQKEA